MQDEDLGGTGHGDISYSDADPGLQPKEYYTHKGYGNKLKQVGAHGF